MKRYRIVLLALCLVVLAPSCKLYHEVEVLEVQDVRLKEFSDKTIEAEVDLLIENPNWYAVKLTRSEIDMSINDKGIGQMQLGEKLKIAKKSKTTQTVHIVADYEDMESNFLANFLTLLFNPKVKFKAEGYMKGRALIFGKKVPVEIEEDLDLNGFDLGANEVD